MTLAMGARRATQQLIAMASPVKSRRSAAYFLPVAVRYDDRGRALAEPRSPRGSGDFLALTEADGFVELPPQAEEFPPGYVATLYRW
jgi:molybdopterin biosynthesis enzyme